jgi:hypothetical protein
MFSLPVEVDCSPNAGDPYHIALPLTFMKNTEFRLTRRAASSDHFSFPVRPRLPAHMNARDAMTLSAVSLVTPFRENTMRSYVRSTDSGKARFSGRSGRILVMSPVPARRRPRRWAPSTEP